jgi:hypothetical protein
MKALVIFSAPALAGCGGSGASGNGTQVLASQGGSAASWSRVDSDTACEAMVPASISAEMEGQGGAQLNEIR